MIFRTLLLGMLLFCSFVVRADFVQANGVWDDSGDPQTSFPLAFASNVTAGNLIIAATRFADDITPTVADTLGSSWTLGQRCYDAGEGLGAIWYWAFAPSSGANTATFTYSIATPQIRIGLLEESNIAAVSPVDGTSCNPSFFGDNSVDAISSGTFTPTVANTRIVGIAFMNSGVTLTAGTDFTLNFGTLAARTWIETRTLATAALTSSTFTMPAGTSIGAVLGFALEPATGSVPSIPAIYKHLRQMKQ